MNDFKTAQNPNFNKTHNLTLNDCERLLKFLSLKRAQRMILDRKKDAHQKIQLGGLLIKAGHQYTDKAVLLAALIELKPKLVPGSPEFLRLKEMGNAAFKSEPKSNSSENSS